MAPDIISPSGANLAAALFRLKSENDLILKDISRELNNLLPNFTSVRVTEEISENRLIIKIFSEDGREFTSRVLSEGTLRLLILCILKYDEKHNGIICFEEPENGIHPYRIDMMIQLLKSLSTEFENTEEPLLPLRQVIVNTHSSVLVGKIIDKYANQQEVSIWFSKLITNISGMKKLKYKSTKIIPVIKKSSKQLQFDFLEPGEIKMTDLDVEKYLDTKDFGN